MNKIIGLIPARKGSKRILGKNMVHVNGKSLLQRAIESAQEADVLDEIVVSTDWGVCMETARRANVGYIKRPAEFATDEAHDFQWVSHALEVFPGFDIFVILRPTSPFRTAETIRRALTAFQIGQPADSMRAIEPTPAHPRKSWVLRAPGMIPYGAAMVQTIILPQGPADFDLPTQALGDVYVQNACIHVAWTQHVEEDGNVSGAMFLPFHTVGYEGVDINTPLDLEFANWLMARVEGPDAPHVDPRHLCYDAA